MAKKIIISDKQIIQIKNLYKDGLTVKEISCILSLEKRNISKILKGLTKSGKFVGISTGDVFMQNSTYNRSNLRLRILKEKILEHICSICGMVGFWNNKDLKLQIDHINGNGTDNRVENLRFLCPNCHSQTPTFGSRNYKEKNKDILLNFPREDLKEIIRSSKSLSEICIKCKLPIRGNLFIYLKEFFQIENLDVSHIFNRHKTQRDRDYLISSDKLFIENCKHHSLTIKNRIIKENLLENKCALCNLLPIWNNEEIILQLDHINGTNTDHQLKNLRLLCPNCHSQTPTFMLGAARLANKK